LRDIAARVGYSHVTVARALSDAEGVRRETRERIRAVAREMGYQSDPSMSRMMRHIRESSDRRKTETIALIYDKGVVMIDPGNQGMREGILDQARSMGYGVDEFAVGPGGLPSTPIR
jgi:DNA-binding LacI/PurR family transcriptional regulator